MNRKYVPLVLGIIAMAIVTVLFFLVFVVKSLEPNDNGWYWNTRFSYDKSLFYQRYEK